MPIPPSLFFSHGAPDVVIRDHPAREFWTSLGREIEPPRGIVMVSAHWQPGRLRITGAEAPKTIHDFSGFAPALYDVQYPARTAPWLVEAVVDALPEAEIDTRRGYDHGAWAPLVAMYPDADVPLVQLSLDRTRDFAGHFEVGRRLAELRNAGILVIGSGAATHSLADMAPPGTPPAGWAVAFDDWLAEALEAGDLDALLDAPNRAPHWTRAHPTDEHFTPLLVALGAGWGSGGARCLHRSWDYGSLSMAQWAFD